MSLWRLEWLRLLRTGRLLTILVVQLFIGLTGPFTARYLAAIVSGLGTDGVRIEFPPPRPVDGIAQYTGNAMQLGLLVIVLVAASALCLDARPEMAVFLRSRVPAGVALRPAVVLNTGAAVAGLACGTAAAWYETAVLLGPPPAGRMLIGFGFAALFLAFAVSLTALAATLTRSAPAAAGLSLGVLLVLAATAVLPPLQHWSPTALAAATPALLRGEQWTDYLPAVLVCVLACAGLLAGAARLAAAREY